jgi:hypothetical protein
MIDREHPGSKRLPSDLGDWPVKRDIEVEIFENRRKSGRI